MYSNQSRELAIERCPRSYYWRYVRDLVPRGQGAKSFLGSAVHAALAALYRGDRSGYLGVYEREIAKFEEPANKDFEKLAPIWRERLERYPVQYAAEGWRVLMVPEQEVPLRMGRHVLMTRIDLIVEEKGHVWVVDHKVTTRTGGSWWAQFFVDKQGSAYILAAQQALGVEIAGWVINAIKPTKEDPFERQAFSRTRGQLESFVRQTAAQLERREKIFAERPPEQWGEADLDEILPQFTHECHNFGICPYLGLCQAGESAAAGLYAKREPDYVDKA